MREVQRYQLPVTILLATMRDLHATVTLHATLASLPQGWNEPCLAELVMVQGAIQTCAIRTMEGLLLLQQEAAYRMLERLGELEWTLQAALPEPSPALRPGHAGTRREAYAGVSVPLPVPAGTLSHRQKQVLLLTESQKRPEEIARLLRLSEAQVEQFLRELAAQHLIIRHDEGRRA